MSQDELTISFLKDPMPTMGVLQEEPENKSEGRFQAATQQRENQPGSDQQLVDTKTAIVGSPYD